ncbi:MAG: hypothetical protein A2275_05530 [Bacteroidetes bacterium RIFOXYA12_FULL_35_11]|nr:MAG: hypothetical protein A2X01_16510 [Bacteroidetes bacterium GWF2_35_48]OFY79533.1 MAG: hypothetical protein A2275_05530 [Bacteroidetes bacterium RIFOXYA12_FULL_35_11]OFY92727.1 MAG: hypothetical protein A2491_20990 [Bacteroidetes bacterium RIFOXYC12_FULL_35_7]HBX53435.1 molybdopterin molybdenumtransferase MoeA [Bacteroidales bacterium]
MIPFEKALDIVISSARELTNERIPMINASGRILAEDVISDTDMPPFHKSAVDGFACKKCDIRMPLEVIETIAAGKIPEKKIESGQCSKIMTGAMLPDGADCVVMVEFSERNSENKVVFSIKETSDNICYKGEDVKKEMTVLKKGTRITPAHIAVMASVGCTNPLVSRKPNVAILTTGDELIEPSEPISGAQIRNSNAYQLIAQAEKCNVNTNYCGIVSDIESVLEKEIEKAHQQNDVILLTGGVSMGDFDFVPAILKKLGFDILFHSIAVQPGKPTLFAKKGNVFCFGLPGNPVSSFLQFELLVKPLLLKLSGNQYQPLNLKLPLAENFSRRRTERLAIVPVIINNESKIIQPDYHGSAHIHALTEANAMMFVPVGVSSINKGELVHVRPL